MLASHRLAALGLLVSLSATIPSPPHLGTSRDLALASVNSKALSARDLPVGTCNSGTPCGNGACCSSDNLCGWSSKFCGDGCQHNCDAKPECGPYAVADSQKCPLNVCCSEFSYCGSTSEFCTWTNPDDPVYPKCDTKYGGCGSVDRPSCGGTSVSKRTIGYYESWSNTRKCQNIAPEDLNLAGFTHINFAFSFFDPETLQIASMDSNAGSLYNRFTGLKSVAAGLQTWISVGGWSFTDPGPYQKAFSTMTSSQSNRAIFISGLMKFMNTYGFDGVDLDWEYPGADDRGGVKADTENYVALVKEMKAAFGSRYGISMTLPTSYWYLQHFDLAGIQPNVDWFNLMSYDLHGTWDAASKFVGSFIAPHTNLTEIDLGLDLLWRSGITPDKVVLGQVWYGRSFALSSPSCDTPNGVCQFSGPADAGPCSNAAGILDNQEINDIISKNSLKPVWDKTAGVKYITWSSNQWVSYDDADTFQQKRDFANKRCLGGLMVWAMDQVDQKASNHLGQAAGVTLSQQDDANQAASDMAAKTTCRYAGCGESCPSGSTEVAESDGQPGQLSTSSKCEKGSYRPLCCDDGTTMGKCQWRGFRGAGLSCMGGCAEGETEVASNTNNHDKKKGDQTCNGGLQTYCCAGFKPSPSRKSLVDSAEDAAKDAAEAAAEQAALDIAAKVFCRVAVPALLAPLEALEALIPFIGEIADIAEIAATPALIQLCVKGVEKEGKAVFKVFGKEHTINMDKPTAKRTTRPPQSSHDPPKTTTKSDPCSKQKRRGEIEVRADCKNTVTEYTGATQTQYDRTTRPCPAGARQACWHYYSAISRTAAWSSLTCDELIRARNFNYNPLQATKVWGDSHAAPWRNWMARPSGLCQRDEWPPAHFWQDKGAGQLVRYNHQEDNNAGGKVWGQFCPEHAVSSCVAGSENDITPNRGPVKRQCRKALTLKVFVIDFDDFTDNAPLAEKADKGLVANQCYPRMPANGPSHPEYFALLNGDPTVGQLNAALWAGAIPQNMMNGQSPPFNKRDLLEFWHDDGNETRRATPEEAGTLALDLLRAHLSVLEDEASGYIDCVGGSCATEITPLARPIATTADVTAPPRVEAITTTTDTTYNADAETTVIRKNWPSRPTFGGELRW